MAFIQKLWDIAWDQWEHCNELIHKQREAKDFQTLKAVKSEVKQEMEKGLADIPTRKYFYFKRPLKELLKQNRAT